jgi:glycosyltransferase involved in cell wall biosynthesis
LKGKEMNHRISVIILYYGAPEAVIDKHITAILNNSFRPYEIIIVNDGHENDLTECLQAYKGLINIVYAKITPDIHWNLSGAANLGLTLSGGDLVSFEDCDVIPEPEYYNELVSIIDYGCDRVYAHYTNEAGRPAGCCVAKKSIYTDVGLLDEDFAGHYGFDDIYIGLKFDRAGYKTGVSEKKLLNWNYDGETHDIERTSIHNYQLMMSKHASGMVNTINRLRFDWKVTRI